MEVLESHIALRRQMNSFYKDLFKEIEGIEVFTEKSDNFYSNHWLSCIIIDSKKTGFTREDLRLHLLKENIESRPLWKPMHLQPIFSKYPFYGSKISENLFNQGLCLPSGSNLTNSDRDRIKSALSYFT